MREILPWMGKWIFSFAGQKWEVFNKITDAGLDWFLSLWAGTGIPGFKYIALGTDPTPTEYTDTQLYSEGIRKPIQELIPARPVLQSLVVFDDTEANFHIREVGLFAGGTATADPNTGILVARSVVDIQKTDQVPGSLKVLREDRLGRVS